MKPEIKIELLSKMSKSMNRSEIINISLYPNEYGGTDEIYIPRELVPNLIKKLEEIETTS